MTKPSMSVIIPARDEATTVAGVVAPLVAAGHEDVVVVDDGSRDRTAAVAAAAGARVVTTRGGGHGKGLAMSAGLAATTGDIVVFVDADLVGFDASWVDLLVGALTARPDAVLAKPRYVRAGAGGRVNELVARPILDLLHPHVAGLAQPLGGEYAARRWALDQIELEPDYGVDLGLVIDVASRFGPGAIVEADLGVRRHRNRDLAALGMIARDVLAVALDRAGVSARGQANRSAKAS